jgi:membrane protein YqaA with SNARE-associated domain
MNHFKADSPVLSAFACQEQPITLLFTLFAVSFIAATLLPAQSELLLAGMVIKQTHPVAVLVITASLGNILGSIVNWWLGTQAERFSHHRLFPVSQNTLARAQRWYQRYGLWSLLMSWVPFIGDPLTVVAGVMRTPLATFTALVALAKTTRYTAIACIALSSL